MSAPWMKFYPRDWRGDQALRAVGLCARGLWMEMLCVMHEASPYGHLVLGGQPVSNAVLARMAGTGVEEVSALLIELQSADVFSTTRKGVIYSRRMVKDKTRADIGRKSVNKRYPQATEKAAENPTPTRSPTSLPTTQKPEAREERRDDKSSLSSGDDAKPKAYPDQFDLAWKAYPHVKGRSSKPKSLAAWRKLPTAERVGLIGAVARYAREGREPRMDCGAPAMDRWLRDAKHEDWLPRAADAAPANPVTPDIQAQRLRHLRDTGEWREAWGERPKAVAA